MKYGILVSMADEPSKEMLRQKGISEQNCVSINNLPYLVTRLTENDAVYINSPTCFISVSQLLAFVEICHTKMTSVYFINTPYLNFGKARRWKGSMIRLGNTILDIQCEARKYMRNHFRLSDEQWGYVDFCIERIGLSIIAAVFAKDGITGRK